MHASSASSRFTKAALAALLTGIGSLAVACNASDFGGGGSFAGRSSDARPDADGQGDAPDADGLGGSDAGDGGDSGLGGGRGDSDGGNSGDSDSDGDSDSGDSDSGDSDGDAGGNDVDEDDDTVAADVCDKPDGEARSTVSLGGEDVPGNGLLGGPDAGHPLGSDFDDYTLTLKGDLILERSSATSGRIGVDAKDSTIQVTYKRGTTACAHDFAFVVRRCPNKDSTEIKRFKLAIGTDNNGSTSFKVPKGDVFLDIVMTVKGSSRKDYGGCALPGTITNKLYGNAMPGFML